MVLLSTSEGEITVKLYNDTPLHRDNFLKLTREGFFDSLLFHRVIHGFMIQTGDPQSKNAPSGSALGNGGPGYTIPAEILPHRFHKKGALAAARQGDNINPNRVSSGSQFYIVQGTTYQTERLLSMEERRNAAEPDFMYGKEQLEAYTTIGGAPHLDGQYTVFGEVVSGLEIIDAIAKQKVDARNRPVEDIRILKATILK